LCGPLIRVRWAGRDTYGRYEKCVQNFGGKPEAKKPFGRPSRGWEDNIRLDLRETGWKGVDWVHLT